jgi:hypothetical protein
LTVRARPPLEISFVLQMAEYGGDALAKAYLEMDARTNKMERSPLTPEAMRNLMSSGLTVEDLLLLINSAGQSFPTAQASISEASGPSVLVTEGTNAPRPIEDPLPPLVPATSPTPYHAMIAVTGPQIPGMSGFSGPTVPQAATYQTASAAREIDWRKVPQVLYPGQQADPARPMPEAPGPYWTRQPGPNDTFFMGVTDEIKDDGHRYEVHTNSHRGVMGQEVLTRPSGHKVYRYFNGNTEQVAQADPAYAGFSNPTPPIPPSGPADTGFDYLNSLN